MVVECLDRLLKTLKRKENAVKRNKRENKKLVLREPVVKRKNQVSTTKTNFLKVSLIELNFSYPWHKVSSSTSKTRTN